MKLNAKGGTLAIAAVLLVVAGIGVAASIKGRQQPDHTTAFDKAAAAALDFTGGGRVTETEAGEKQEGYEVEITLDNGHKVDIRLDANFKVIGQEADDDDNEKDDEKDDGPDVD